MKTIETRSHVRADSVLRSNLPTNLLRGYAEKGLSMRRMRWVSGFWCWSWLLATAYATPVRSAEPKQSCAENSGLCWPILCRGSRGEKVRALQYLLRWRGEKLRADGDFGFSTESAVRRFQQTKHLKVDGWVGWQTWEKLIPTLKQGAKGEAVLALQELLSQRYKLKMRDGTYGSQTAKAVRRVQRDIPWKENGDIDGIAHPDVWCVAAGGWFDGE